MHIHSHAYTLPHGYFHPSILCSPLSSANHCAAYSTTSSTSISWINTNIDCVWSCTNWTPTENTATPRIWTCLPTCLPRTPDKEVQWRWCWRCGGGSECQLRSGRRTKCQLDSPHTLLLCLRQRWRTGGWTFLSYCARCNVITDIPTGQTPGLIIPSKHTFVTISSPSTASVTDWYINLSAPLDSQWSVRLFSHSSWGQQSNLSGWSGYDWSCVCVEC